MIGFVHILTLPDSTRIQATEEHLYLNGVVGKRFYGINAVKMGLTTVNPYEVDAPGSGYIMPQKHTGMHLSHFLMWRHFLYDHEYGDFTVFEDDVRLIEDWNKILIENGPEVPGDWDIVMLGSCCTDGRPKTHISGNIYRVEYPLCTHAYMVRRKALPILLETQEKSWAPIDLSLYFNSYPKLNVYTILPRIAYQDGMDLPI